MNFDRVTMTGADDSVRPEDLFHLSERYPFVEWGILVSRNNEGMPRYPSREWLLRLVDLASKRPIRLSLHVCGHWVRQLLLGVNEMPDGMEDVFQRIQLNFHAEKTPCNRDAFAQALVALGEKQFIFQIDGALGNAHFEAIHAPNDGDIDAVPLFDISGGAGILPSEWPAAKYKLDEGRPLYHGFAGGLGPDNLPAQLPLIAAAAGDAPYWIDMETRVRSDNDRQFDLGKVQSCLELARHFMASDVVEACAKMREEARQVYTAANAVDDARWLINQPDGLMSPARTRQLIQTLLAAIEASPCYYKGVVLGIPTFTMLAYDPAGHAAIRLWAQLAEQHGARPEKWSSALAMVLSWERRDDLRWPT